MKLHERSQGTTLEWRKMTRLIATTILSLSLAAGASAAEKVDPAGAPPAELNATVSSLLAKDGYKVTGPDGKVICEIWLRAAMPAGYASKEESVSMTMIAPAALLGAVRFPTRYADRRGQTIQPGVYTMRYGNYPQNGDHQGAAPQRDFMVLSPAADDTNGAANPDFDPLMKLSRKASGTPHPAVFSFWKGEGDGKAGFHKEGESDWVLKSKIGEVPVAIILVGKAEG